MSDRWNRRPARRPKCAHPVLLAARSSTVGQCRERDPVIGMGERGRLESRSDEHGLGVAPELPDQLRQGDKPCYALRPGHLPGRGRRSARATHVHRTSLCSSASVSGSTEIAVPACGPSAIRNSRQVVPFLGRQTDTFATALHHVSRRAKTAWPGMADGHAVRRRRRRAPDPHGMTGTMGERNDGEVPLRVRRSRLRGGWIARAVAGGSLDAGDGRRVRSPLVNVDGRVRRHRRPLPAVQPVAFDGVALAGGCSPAADAAGSTTCERGCVDGLPNLRIEMHDVSHRR